MSSAPRRQPAVEYGRDHLLATHALRKIRDGFLGLAYPQDCRLCGNAIESWDEGVTCAECWDDPAVTQILSGSLCAKCGISLRTSIQSKDILCGMCSDLPYVALRACGIYSGALEASILFLKSYPHLCSRVRRIVKQTLREHRDVLTSDVVLTVPLHRDRERQRGFNQAAIIAKVLDHELGTRSNERALVRVKPTERHRAGMDAADRTASVDRAFEVAHPRVVQGKSVLLVDDVHTTGSTVSAASKCLLNAGAKRVAVFTIARV